MHAYHPIVVAGNRSACLPNWWIVFFFCCSLFPRHSLSVCLSFSFPISVQVQFPRQHNAHHQQLHDHFNRRRLPVALHDEESRGKKKHDDAYVLIPLVLGSIMMPFALGALALLAGKAIIVAKLALLLSTIIGVKKLLSHSDDGGTHHQSSHDIVFGGERRNAAADLTAYRNHHHN